MLTLTLTLTLTLVNAWGRDGTGLNHDKISSSKVDNILDVIFNLNEIVVKILVLFVGKKRSINNSLLLLSSTELF